METELRHFQPAASWGYGVPHIACLLPNPSLSWSLSSTQEKRWKLTYPGSHWYSVESYDLKCEPKGPSSMCPTPHSSHAPLYHFLMGRNQGIFLRLRTYFLPHSSEERPFSEEWSTTAWGPKGTWKKKPLAMAQSGFDIFDDHLCDGANRLTLRLLKMGGKSGHCRELKLWRTSG